MRSSDFANLGARICISLGMASLIACGSAAGSAGESGGDGGGSGDDGGAGVDAESDCEAPDMLLLIDRTMSMHRNPEGDPPAQNTPLGRATSKWAIAVNSIEGATAALDDGIRFGLALFPRDPGGDICVTLQQRIAGTSATNTSCEGGEVPVSPVADAANAIDAAIDVETTRLCRSTPIGAGLETARSELASVQDSIRKQFVVLLTDGEDTCDQNLALSTVQIMASEQVLTYVIGFDSSGGGIDNGLLNDLACAGGTATGFPGACTADANGNYSATDRDGPPLYQLAEDAAQLTQTLEGFAGEVCCGCVD